MRYTVFRTLALLWLMPVLALSGCELPTTFPGPIAEPDATEIDRRLVGSWYATEEWEVMFTDESFLVIWYLNIGLSEDELLNGVIIATPAQPESVDEDDTVIWFAAKAWPSTVHGEVFYNIFVKQGHWGACSVADVGCHSVAHVSFPDDDTLLLRFVGGETVSALVKEGKLPGKEMGKIEYNYFVDIGSAEIVSLLRAHPGDELFQVPEKPIVFRRLKPTAAAQ